MKSFNVFLESSFRCFCDDFRLDGAVFVAVGSWCVRHYALMQHDLWLWTENLMVTVQKSTWCICLFPFWIHDFTLILHTTMVEFNRWFTHTLIFFLKNLLHYSVIFEIWRGGGFVCWLSFICKKTWITFLRI